MEIRLPRVVLAAAVGAALAVSGAGLQGLFRNPLAEPQLIGVSGGAALGAIGMMVLGAGLRLPSWLLLDEPTANLDVAHALGMLDLVRCWAAQRTGVVVVLHDLNPAARAVERVLLLSQGRPVALGPPEQVLVGDRLSDVYGTPVHVEHHGLLDRLVVMT